MTERSPAKVKRSEEAKGQRKASPTLRSADADEVARLKNELAAAHARIAELEERQAEIVNRIDWVIDSLQSLGN